MAGHVERGFLARRFARDHHLGLPLTLGVFIVAVGVVLFVTIGYLIAGNPALLDLDTTVGQSLAEHRRSSPGWREFFLVVTHVGGVPAMFGVAIVTAAVVWLCRQPRLAIFCLLIPTAGGLMNLGTKSFYERERPSWKDEAVPETNFSYPSGHSMGSLIGYGLVAYVLIRLVPRRGVRLAAVAAVVGTVLVIGLSRVYLGAHFLSDVVGGYAVGAAALTAWLTGLEVVRRRTPPEGPIGAVA
jgi:undecaprenyl-diphosphatase